MKNSRLNVLMIFELTVLMIFVGCGDKAVSSAASDNEKNGKILIAYFSRAGENSTVGNIVTGNTEIVANLILSKTGGTLFHIQTENPYPDSYDECTDIAKQEQEDNSRPKLKKNVENIEDYDVIFLGYPIWWEDVPMAINSFIENNNLDGKTIIPFCTHEGSGQCKTAQSIANACPNSKVLNAFEIRGNIAQNDRGKALSNVVNWLKEINMI